MTTIVEQAITRAVPRADSRSWLTWGIAVFGGFEAVHLIGGTLGNDWEGWGNFLGNLSFIVVTGLVIVGLTYGVLVRWCLKPSQRGNRPAVTALAAGVLSIASYAIPLDLRRLTPNGLERGPETRAAARGRRLLAAAQPDVRP